MIKKLTDIKHLKESYTKQEEGFTLVEIMAVLVIIGLMAAVILPIFTSQQTASIEATLKTDMRNAGLIMRTESTKNQGRMLSYLPSFATQSAENQVSLDSSRSNEYYYCLVGTNANLTDTLYYSSFNGKITKTGCPTLSNTPGGPGVTPPTTPGSTPVVSGSGASFDEAQDIDLATKKAAVVYNNNLSASAVNNVKNNVAALGFSEVTTASNGTFYNWSEAETNSYELIVFYNQAWSSGDSLKDKIANYYRQGGLVFHEGNDTGSSVSILVASSTNLSNAGAAYTPTFNQGTNPTFPYTFDAVGFGSDSSWQCVTRTSNTVVDVAVTKYSDRECITLAAVNNDAGGRYIYATSLANGFSQPIKSSFQWLLS